MITVSPKNIQLNSMMRALRLTPGDYTEFSQVIKGKKWTQLRNSVEQECETLVKEFYTHVIIFKDPKPSDVAYQSWFIGGVVDYSPDAIRTLLHMDPHKTEEDGSDFHSFVNILTKQQIAEAIALPGNVWEANRFYPHEQFEEDT